MSGRSRGVPLHIVTMQHMAFGEYVAVARRFSAASGLLRHPGVRRIIEEVEAAGGAASMIMLGNAVFATVAFEGASETRLTRHRVRVVE